MSTEEHHIVGPKTYLPVFASLLVLLLLTVGATWWHISPLANLAIALIIAIIKATLIIFFFMHLKWSSPLAKIFCAGAFLWLLILFGFLGMDYLTRVQMSPMADFH